MTDVDGLTVEWTGLRHRHRIRLEPHGGTWMKIHERFGDDGWREVGREPAEDVVAETPAETLIAP